MRGQALEELGDCDLALKALATAARLSDQNSKALSLTGPILGRSGRTAEMLALVHAGLGDGGAAFEWLDRAYTARDVAPHVPHGRRQVESLS